MGLRRFVPAVVVALVLTGLVAGLVTGVFASATTRGLYASGLWSSNGPSTVAPGTFDPPATPDPSPTSASPRPGTDGVPAPVLPVATEARTSSATRVGARIEAVDSAVMGGTVSAEVVALASGKELYSHRADTAAIPASTTKLLTSTAALSLLGPDHVFTTAVVRTAARKVVLVGGGDPYLASTSDPDAYPRRASLAVLAQDTAAALKRAGTTKVSLGYDASLFTGPAWNRSWPATYADQVTPVSALWVDEGWTAGVSPGPRVQNPARDAGRAFAAALEKRGITVIATTPARASASATTVATASSMPLEQIVEHLLMASDNDAAEVLLRQVALAADRPGSAEDGTRAVRRELTRLGVWADGSRQLDGSGLSRQTALPAAALVDVLRLASASRHPELRSVITGLPVAGVEGSLRIRYADAASLAGRGVVRAKTGTLSGVHALAGYLRTADGEQLAFAFVVNDATDDDAAVVWLDRVSAALSRCGC